MWISGPTEGLENIFLLLQSTSNPDKRVYECTVFWILISYFDALFTHRFREFRQPGQRPSSNPSHERIPDRNEKTQSPVEETQGRQPAILKRTYSAPSRKKKFNSLSNEELAKKDKKRFLTNTRNIHNSKGNSVQYYVRTQNQTFGNEETF